MRCAVPLTIGFAISLWSSGARAQPADPPPPPLSDEALATKYVWNTLGPSGMVSATITSALEDWRGSPRAWDRDTHGYLQRWASEYAAAAIGSTTKYAVARLFHQDPSFVPCTCTGAAPRLRHALGGPFIARTQDGEWVFSGATVMGIAAQNIVPAATWYPEPRGVRDGAAHVLTGVLAKMAVDTAKEFVPKRWLRNPFRRAR